MRISTLLVAGFGVALLAGCSVRSDVAWQADGPPRHDHPHQDWWQYQYVYDYTQQIYHEPYTGRYWWHDGLDWLTAEALPWPMKMNARHCTVIKGDRPTPPFHHGVAWTVAGPLDDQHPIGEDHAWPVRLEMVSLEDF